MQIITKISELKRQVADCKKKEKTIGLVPTMGALHAGHASLVRQSVKENNVTFVSVFVNPTQFNNKEDLQKYPRDLQRDAELLSTLGVDYLFAPAAEDIYTQEELNSIFQFDFAGLDQVMEGKFRPGHFNGVVQIVSRLFLLIQPDRAYFGEKDFQQLAIIRHMVALKDFLPQEAKPQIIGCPIVREPSGLALSSRNERLSAEEKQIATNISRILFESRQLTASQTVAQVQSWVIEQINRIEGLTIEYYQIVDEKSLQPAQTFEHAVGCVTVYCGPVRLIDNIKY